MLNRFLILFSIFISIPVLAKLEPLRVALFDKPPFAYKEDGVMKGFHYSVAQGIADRTGRKLQINLVPVRRAIELLRQGQVDIVIMTDQTSFEEMKTKKAFLISANTFIYTKADHKPVLSKKDIAGNMARLAGGCTEFNDLPGVKWSDLKSYEQTLDVLLLSRVEGVCGTVAFQAILNRRKISADQVKTYTVLDKAVWVHALPTINEKKWKEIESNVQSLIKDGSVDYWARKFLKPES